MKKFELPEIEVINLMVGDIITASPDDDYEIGDNETLPGIRG